MKNKKLIYILSAFLALAFLSLGAYSTKESSGIDRLAKISNNDDNAYIAINQVLMWIGNNGMGSHDPGADASGFYWPGGEKAEVTAIFADGLIWGAKVGREIRCGGATYNYGLQAGKILDNGLADDPTLDKYRIYRIRKDPSQVPDADVQAKMYRDIEEWPGEDGAPYVDVNNNGVYDRGVDQPDYIGDEVLYCVMNDLDASRTTQLYGTNPMGLEVHCLVFGFNQNGDFGDMVFKKYTVINKGQRRLDEMVLGYWSDPDLGNAEDDFTGCDVELSLGYCYNGDNYDEDNYNGAPPAVGYDFFQGPIVQATEADSAKFLDGWRHGYRNLPMTAFTFYINGSDVYADPDLASPAGSVQMYNYLTGYIWDGTEFQDPVTGTTTKICLSGDPVNGSGWYEGGGWPGGEAPGDRRHLMASGPFTMEPGDTQEIVVGILIARGGDNIESVKELKEVDIAAQLAYDLDFNIVGPPPAPIVHYYNSDKKITLWWENNAESYDEFDPLLVRDEASDTTWTFQGYRIYQLSSAQSVLSDDDTELLGTCDIKDSISVVNIPTDIAIDTILANSDTTAVVYDTLWMAGDTITVTVAGTEVEVEASRDSIVAIYTINDEYEQLYHEELLYALPNKGVSNTFEVTEDKINSGTLVNGTPYYFAITAIGVNVYSDERVKESSAVIVTVYPRKENIDEAPSLPVNSVHQGTLIAGNPDARVEYTIADPYGLQNATYEVEIAEVDSALGFIVQKVLPDSLDTLRQEVNFGVETDTSTFDKVTDGFIVNVYDDGRTIIGEDRKSTMKNIVEVVNGVETGSVFNTTSSNGNWQIISDTFLPAVKVKPEATDPETFNINDLVGEGTYEIRFTSRGSQYYLGQMGFISLRGFIEKGDPLAADRVPFEIWSLGDDLESTDDDQRLVVVVKDNEDYSDGNWPSHDGTWTQRTNGQWEPFYALDAQGVYPDVFDSEAKNYSKTKYQLFGNIVIDGDLPAEGTVIRFNTYRRLEIGDKYTFSVEASSESNKDVAKDNINRITVYPNPYYGTHSLEQNKYSRFVRFLGLPVEATIRIYSLAGVFVTRIDKDSRTDYVDWNLLNRERLPVASGVYLAHIDMPGVGEKILKIAVIMEAQYLDRI